MLDAQKSDSPVPRLRQSLVGHQLDSVVVGRLDSVVAERAVADELQAFGRHNISGLLVFVSPLQHGLQKFSAKV